MTVRVSRTLSRTRFVAFGDSITRGRSVSLQPLMTLGLMETYPFKLEQMLLSAIRLKRSSSATGESAVSTRPGRETTARCAQYGAARSVAASRRRERGLELLARVTQAANVGR